MMMKLLSGILVILAVSYGWEGSKINPILCDLVGTGFWRQKPIGVGDEVVGYVEGKLRCWVCIKVEYNVD